MPDSTKVHCGRTPDPVLAQQEVNMDSLLSLYHFPAKSICLVVLVCLCVSPQDYLQCNNVFAFTRGVSRAKEQLFKFC